MAYVCKSKSGKKIVLRNPAEKGRRYARQLKSGKVTETGKKLTKNQKSWRAGYLTARSDSAKAFKSKRSRRRKSR